MDTRHKNLKFIFGFEQTSGFSFIDVKITRGINRFSTSVFRKATFSGVFTNFDSFIFQSYKTDLIFTVSLFYNLLRYANISFRSRKTATNFQM